MKNFREDIVELQEAWRVDYLIHQRKHDNNYTEQDLFCFAWARGYQYAYKKLIEKYNADQDNNI